jgi:hypothetical protein
MQLQTIATLLALASSTLASAIDIHADVRATCKPIYKDIIYNCGSSSDLLTINNISISPDEPVRGQKLYIKGDGYLKERVTGGNVHVEATRGIFKITRDYDICKTAPEYGKECPFEQGDVSFDGSVDVDKDIAPGRYNIDVLATSNTKKIISKLNLKVLVR